MDGSASTATVPSPFVEALINLTLQSQLEAVELNNSSEMMELAASVLKIHCHRSVVCGHLLLPLGTDTPLQKLQTMERALRQTSV
jgi:hypothetical protein